MSTKIKVMDYNIRYCDDGENKMIADRAPRLEAVIRKYDPDVIGLQEATHRWIDYLDAHFHNTYRMLYLYRNENSREATPILFKRDKFTLVREGHFWLSDMPEMSTKSFGSKHYRICNFVRLRVNETGEEFFFINTHMGGGYASLKSADLIMKRMEARGAFTELPALLTGDFNFAPFGRRLGEAYKFLNESGKFRDINDALGYDFSTSVNGYNEREGGDIIDYVFYTPFKMKPVSYQVLNEYVNEGWVSDHRGLFAEVELTEEE